MVCRARSTHDGKIAFDAMRAPPETPFIALARSRRFVCSACGSRDVHLRARPRLP
jgi:hypothetical protein